MILICIFCCVTVVLAGSSSDVKENYKDQFCTDPRTMRKHAAYTEWADAYSCSRHRCQPGGRNLAIYTVGCKRVEAPESAIECEEVVEDTNMQFPFCCTRLRCLVVVRGEVWTRVLGQPWETLPAAPWSHMYKMKKPPPTDTTFLPKGIPFPMAHEVTPLLQIKNDLLINPISATLRTGEQGPIYELAEHEGEGARDKVLRAAKTTVPDSTDCNEVVPRAAPPPDIVIALSTNSEQQKDHKKEGTRHKRMRKAPNNPYFEEEHHEADPNDVEEAAISMSTEKPAELSEERFYANAYGVTQKVPFKNPHHQVAWTEIPQNQWNEHDPSMDQENRDAAYHQTDFAPPEPEKKEERPSNLQALVDAIGTRMRDIENVVQRMSEKVHQAKPVEAGSTEKRTAPDPEPNPHKHHKGEQETKDFGKTKRPGPDGEHYKRFSVRNRGSKYLHGTTDVTTDQPLFVEDTNMNGYFSDASNGLLRRASSPKEPAAPTYMAPVDTRRKPSAHIAVVSDVSEDDKKRKKHSHKKRKNKGGRSHKKHRAKDDKRKHFSRVSSVEIDKNVVSLEDSSAVVSK